MSLGSKTDNSNVALTVTLTTTVLAVPAANTKRYIRGMRITNGNAAQQTFSLGLATAGVAPAVTDAGKIGILVPVAANSSIDIPFPGDGLEMTNGGLPITGGASSTNMSVMFFAVLVVA